MAALAAVPWIAKALTIGKAVAASKAVSVGAKVVKGAVAAKTVSDVAKGGRAKPTPPPPPVAPLPDEEETRRATRRRAALRFGQLGSGRASTVLEDSNGKLGSGY